MKQNNLLMQSKDHQFMSHSYEETIAIGKTLGQSLKGGELLLLKGPLGSGKTCLTKGIALALGINENITSASFTLINIYEGNRLLLCHSDLYRIENNNDFFDLGIEEYISANTVVIIEWGDRFIEEFPYPLLIIELTILGESKRQIKLTQ